MTGTSIVFDGNNLQTANIAVNQIDHESGPTKNAPMYGIAHANFSSIPFINYPSKVVTLTGTLVADSIPLMDVLVDTFKGYFTGKDRNLDIAYGSGTRRYICTPESPIVSRPGGLTFATFSVTFDCTYPFGRDVLQATALAATGRTLSTYSDSLIFNGNAPLQFPVITITYTAVTGGTAKTVSVGNNSNGQQISVKSTFITGDVLQIDTLNNIVTKNGTLIDFTGAFPQFPPNSQSMGYGDGLTTRTFNINVSYYPMWM